MMEIDEMLISSTLTEKEKCDMQSETRNETSSDINYQWSLIGCPII